MSRLAALSWVSKVGLATVVSASLVGGPLLVARSLHQPSGAASPAVQRTVARSERPNGAAINPTMEMVRQEPAPESTSKELAPAAAAAAAAAPARADGRRATEADTVVRLSATAAQSAGRVAPTPAAAAEALPGAPSAAVGAFEVAPADPSPPGAAPADPSPPGVPPVEIASALREETLLIDGAFAALRAGDRTTAARLVDEHARRFPQGSLWRERERARAKLLDPTFRAQQPL